MSKELKVLLTMPVPTRFVILVGQLHSQVAKGFLMILSRRKQSQVPVYFVNKNWSEAVHTLGGLRNERAYKPKSVIVIIKWLHFKNFKVSELPAGSRWRSK